MTTDLTTTLVDDSRSIELDDQYYTYLDEVSAYASRKFSEAKGKLFIVNIDKSVLWETYLNFFPTENRQRYDCSTCKSFFSAYGCIVSIDTDGKLIPIIWDPAMENSVFSDLSKALHDIVVTGKVIDVFSNVHDSIGICDIDETEKGIFRHFHVSENAKSALTKNDFSDIKYSYIFISKNKITTFVKLEHILKTITRTHGDHSLVKEYLKKVELISSYKKIISKFDNRDQRKHMLYSYIFDNKLYHLSGSVFGAMVKDINNGLSTEYIIERFLKHTASYNYKHTKAVTVNHLDTFAQFIKAHPEYEAVFNRRFATMADIPEELMVWSPQPIENSSDDGIISTIDKIKDDITDSSKISEVISRSKIFIDEIMELLDDIADISIFVRRNELVFSGYTMSCDTEALSLYKHGHFSSYTYAVRTQQEFCQIFDLANWNLSEGFYSVTAILMDDDHGKVPTFIIDKCVDMLHTLDDMKFTPQRLVPELYEYRHAITKICSDVKLKPLPLGETRIGGGTLCDKWQPLKIKITYKDGTVVFYDS